MTVVAEPVPQERIAAVRRFNRFYTQRIGVLQGAWLDSPFSLTEARVLYELKQRASTTATEIARELGLDAGYLSRILRRFQKLRLIKKETSPADARQSFLTLTEHGRKAFAPLETRSNRDVAAMLAKLPAAQQDDLVDALQMAEGLMSETARRRADVALRAPRAGDFGWIVQRHAVLYQREYGWCDEFEGVCAQIVADFIKKFDPCCERGWIAELNGQNVGSVLLAKDSDEVARLRLLLVEPAARGLGIGKRLTDECIRFARERGYRRMTLWTHSVLSAARHVYGQAGFQLTSSEPRRSFGQDVVSEHWDMSL
ncbi:MAG TPA: helix-turn-helix domain-containing GNAT family N-acetyltransferase [Burkholderiales bacterium]|jgi:DNA-binding MarR family transcriptional regulator/N-acetylglutamate synthase-like GNAT family acetyltransferase|nr:helix-turn-helix domain-containing GNAT family N-acetyltransferase [Burkholderiales bacterium]